MKLGVDLGHIAEGETGGLVPYLQGVLEALFSGWPQHEIVVFGTPANEHLFPTLPRHVQRLTFGANDYYLLLDASATALNLDVLFSSYPSEAELTFPSARRVVLIPDCQHEFFPDFFDAEMLRGRRRAFAAVLQSAGAIATLSEHSKQTLSSHPEARCSDVFVSSPALRTQWNEPALDDLTPEERDLVPGGDFFIYPANLWPHKNHRRVLEAFERFLRNSPRPMEFVFTGHPQGWDELRSQFPNLPIRHLGFVRRGFLQVLLARARGLVFFSMFEGFGMPLLEAFAAGTPVACSNTSSLPEVGGAAVLACDPTDIGAMSGLMAQVCSDEALRTRLVERGRDRLAQYDWHSSAAQLIGACERVRDRTAGAAPAALPALRRVAQAVQEIQADRAARLESIQRLDTDLRASLADREAQREVIRGVLDMLRKADEDRQNAHAMLQRANEDRQALHATVERLDALLHEWIIKRRLRSCKRLLQRWLSGLPRFSGTSRP